MNSGLVLGLMSFLFLLFGYLGVPVPFGENVVRRPHGVRLPDGASVAVLAFERLHVRQAITAAAPAG